MHAAHASGFGRRLWRFTCKRVLLSRLVPLRGVYGYGYRRGLSEASPKVVQREPSQTARAASDTDRSPYLYKQQEHEQQPLLLKPNELPGNLPFVGLLPPNNGGSGPQVKTIWKDIQRILLLAGPILCQYAIAHSSHMIDTSFVGHLGDPALLSSMVLGGSLAMVSGYYVMRGLASASETLSGQAHGARNPVALAMTLQRSLAVCAAAAVPITALWWQAEPLLVALGQEPEIAAGAARYLQLTLPGLYSYTIFDCIDRHLLAQNVVTPGVAITAVSTALTPLYCWFFVYHLDLKLDGAAFAYCCSHLTNAALSVGYLLWRARRTEGGADAIPLAPSGAALTNWGPYLALALPAMIMGCMEGWAVEVLIFLAGRLEAAEVAVGVTGLCLQFSTLVWLSAASISSATATRIANALGKGDVAGAKRLSYTSLGLVLASQTLIGLAAFSFRSPMVGLMTSDQDVLALAEQVLPVLAICFVFDGQNAVLSAILRGAGRQWLGAGCNLAGWWGVGVPLAYYLGLPAGWGVRGLWAGFAVASALQAFVQLAVVSRLDWAEEVRRAEKMVLSSIGGSSEEEGEKDGVMDTSVGAARAQNDDGAFVPVGAKDEWDGREGGGGGS